MLEHAAFQSQPLILLGSGPTSLTGTTAVAPHGAFCLQTDNPFKTKSTFLKQKLCCPLQINL